MASQRDVLTDGDKLILTHTTQTLAPKHIQKTNVHQTRDYFGLLSTRKKYQRRTMAYYLI